MFIIDKKLQFMGEKFKCKCKKPDIKPLFGCRNLGNTVCVVCSTHFDSNGYKIKTFKQKNFKKRTKKEWKEYWAKKKKAEQA